MLAPSSLVVSCFRDDNVLKSERMACNTRRGNDIRGHLQDGCHILVGHTFCDHALVHAMMICRFIDTVSGSYIYQLTCVVWLQASLMKYSNIKSSKLFLSQEPEHHAS